jgi:hypothetical protein
MKTPSYFHKISLITLLLLANACTGDFEAINTDPNNPNQVPTSYLIASAERSLVKEIMGMYNVTGKNGYAIRYVQMITATVYTGTDRYEDVNDDFTAIYTDGLADLVEVIALNQSEKTKIYAASSGANVNQIALARILKVWAFQAVTDIWGDVPYFNALKKSTNLAPAYDAQKDIYFDLVKELNEASAQIDEAAAPVNGDILYGGDMASWKLFAHSLKMKIGMRMAKVDPVMAAKTVAEAYEAGIFTENTQNAYYQYLSSQPNNNYWNWRFFSSFGGLAITNTMADKLKDLNDPRLPVYAAETADGTGYNGMPYGVNEGGDGIPVSSVSEPGELVLKADFPTTLLSFTEIAFFEAEAAARGWITGDAQNFYKAAISASMQQWGITDAATIEAYYDQPGVAFDEVNYLKSIGEQKWLALYMNGLEAWCEWRRLDYPTLTRAPAAFANRDIPRRRGYPLNEATLNATNYTTAVGRQGTDNLATRVWWDKK